MPRVIFLVVGVSVRGAFDGGVLVVSIFGTTGDFASSAVVLPGLSSGVFGLKVTRTFLGTGDSIDESVAVRLSAVVVKSMNFSVELVVFLVVVLFVPDD